MSIVTVLVVCFLLKSVQSVTFETTRRLFNRLTENDTKYIRPVLNQSHQVDIDVEVRAYNLKMFDVTSGRFSLLSSFVFQWRDEYKIWDPKIYEGLKSIHLPKANVWVPNILIENSADLTAILTNDNSPVEVEVKSDGEISMIIPAVFDVLCEPNIQKYPFDEHECKIVFITDRSSNEIKLQASRPIDTNQIRENAVWDITGSTLQANIKRKTNSAVYFILTFTRYSNFQVMNFVVPVIVLVILNLLVFVIPPESGERVSYSITILLSFVVFISGITNQLPETNTPLCVFNVYLVVQLIYSALISTSLIRVAWMFHRESDTNIPIALEYLFGSQKPCSCRQLIRIGHAVQVTPDDDSKHENKKLTDGNTWQTLARKVDKAVFYFFAVFVVTETVTIILFLI